MNTGKLGPILIPLFLAGISAFGQSTTTTITATSGGTIVKASADLALTKTVTKPPLGNGPATFDIVVTNLGPFPALGPIVITDAVPTGTSFGPLPGAPWSCSVSAGTLTCTHPGPLSVNNALVLTLTMFGSPTAPFGSVTNCASVKSNTFDPHLDNNRDCACTNFKPCRDLTIDISTGSNNGVALPLGTQDADWRVVSAPSPVVANVNAWVPTSVASWVAAPPGSQWISAAKIRSDTEGNYHYQFSFALGDEWTGRPCTLSFQWAVDDEAQFKLDNNPPFLTTGAFGTSVTSSNHTALHSSSAISVGPGSHVLDVNVQNGPPGSSGVSDPTGLLVKGAITCRCLNKMPPGTSTQ